MAVKHPCPIECRVLEQFHLYIVRLSSLTQECERYCDIIILYYMISLQKRRRKRETFHYLGEPGEGIIY